ncbi:hypothetical protein D3C87_1217790 [compost metagenome]
MNLELILPDPMKEAKQIFLSDVVNMREAAILLHATNREDPFEGPVANAVNYLTGQILEYLDGGEMHNAGYTVLPNRMLRGGTEGTLPNIAGELYMDYTALFEDIND